METSPEQPEKQDKFFRSVGVTGAERHLQRLCDRSFLSFWSYSGVYRDQGGHTARGGDGKEVCDVLVVFDKHIIIFSDKDCAFPDTGDLDLDWKRWYKKAIRNSAEQIWGAENWIMWGLQRRVTLLAAEKPIHDRP